MCRVTCVAVWSDNGPFSDTLGSGATQMGAWHAEASLLASLPAFPGTAALKDLMTRNAAESGDTWSSAGRWPA